MEYGFNLENLLLNHVGRSSSVGTATRYGVEGPEIQFGEGEIFLTRPDRTCGPPSPVSIGCRVIVRGVKRPEHGVNHPPLSSAVVKERVDLYLYFLSGSSRPILRRALPSPLPPSLRLFISKSPANPKVMELGIIFRNCYVMRTCAFSSQCDDDPGDDDDGSLLTKPSVSRCQETSRQTA